MERAFLPAGEEEAEYGFEVLPALYAPLQTESLEAANILQLQNQPVLELRGQGVLVGAYRHGDRLYEPRAFRIRRERAGSWPSGIRPEQGGAPPEGIGYGTVYSREGLKPGVEKRRPLRGCAVPGSDRPWGRSWRRSAAGSADPETGFIGAAPLADIAVVKLKPAKQYLKDYFMVPEEAEAYQENDIMLGLRFLHELAQRERKPLVICMALGTNMGGHAGTSPLSFYLNTIGSLSGRCVVTAGGNEANRGHHFYGTLGRDEEYQAVELRVAQGERGLMLQLWSSTPDVLSVSLISPFGRGDSPGHAGRPKPPVRFPF